MGLFHGADYMNGVEVSCAEGKAGRVMVELPGGIL